MIPKKIHYIWLGEKPKSKLTEICINSWKRYLPEYEIVEWNEHNIDIEALKQKNLFFAKCFELKLWAFVSDYLRLWILEKEGGIYFDTDVEVIKPIDRLLNSPAFLGYEEGDYIGTAIIGSVAHGSMVKRLLDFYEKEIWEVNFINNPIIFKYVLENDQATFDGCMLYPQEYFSPYVPGKQYNKTVENTETYTIHWYTQNWNINCKGYIFTHTKHIKNPFIKAVVSVRKWIGYNRKKIRKR